MIGSALEEGAPETIIAFPFQPAPFSDVAETLAHETTYASDLAEVVHVEVPVQEGAQPAKTETPAVEAAAAEIPQPAVDEPAAGVKAAETAGHEDEPAAHAGQEHTSSPEAAEEPPGEPAAAETADTFEETPEAPEAAVPPPPPITLFPLPKASELHHLEVLPPSALAVRRFDQDAVQALFMTEETLDLPKISRLAASLPGIYACVIATRDQACTGGTLPDGFDLAALLGLAPRVGEAANRMPIGQLKHFTLYGDAYSVSFFERHGLSLCAVHRPRSFVPGVREKLVALADELSR
jgi:hypothetical protein